MSRRRIVTHSGTFHTDDCFAVATLSILLKSTSKEVELIRTREPKKIATGDYVVDVGSVYDADKDRFDHHQPEGAGKRGNGIPYAAFGLVWKKFGVEICGSSEVADRIEKELVQFVDAFDNGVGELRPVAADAFPYSVDQAVSAFSPTWRDESGDYDRSFIEASEFAEGVLKRLIRSLKAEVAAEKIVRSIYKELSDKRLIVLDKNYPWQRVLGEYPEPQFVVAPSGSGWHVEAVRIAPNVFISRKYLPADWAGKRDDELAKITGVKDAVYCTNSCYAAIAKSKEGAIALAKKALDSFE